MTKKTYTPRDRFVELVDQGIVMSHAGRLVGVTKETAAKWAKNLPKQHYYPLPSPAWVAKIARAIELRKTGLSLVATASAVGLSYEDVLITCSGIRPAIALPDLPGVKPPPDIAPGQMVVTCSPETIATIQQMRKDRYTLAAIARATGMSVATIAKHSQPVTAGRAEKGDHRVKVTPEVHKEIRRLRYTEYMSHAKIARRLKLDPVTVARYASLEPQ